MNYEDFDIQDSKPIIEAAGLTVEEVITMLPITKQTYYNWLRGRPVRDQLRYRLTAVRFALLDKAVDMELLPLPEHTPKAMRHDLIRKAMSKVKS